MNCKTNFAIAFFLMHFSVYCQGQFYSSLLLQKNLTENANAIVRSSEVNVTIESIDKMVVFEKRIITVLNEKGNDAVHAVAYYDNNDKIKTLQALVFDSFGTQIKKIKKDDFKDVSAVDGGTLYSDSRVKYLEYTPIAYPYTIEFTCESVTSNTAFIQPFMPITDYFVSVENSSYNLTYPEGMEIRKKEKHFENVTLEKEEKLGSMSFKVKNLEVVKPEDESPSFLDLAPKIMFAAKQFSLEGVNAEVDNWEDFGKWLYNDLIKDTYDLNPQTISTVQNLVKDEKDDLEKIKKIYRYVQDKTRYISVQVGIGGWKPFNASYVDAVSYGDCKALTNYTMSLLKAVGINSNFTLVYAGGSKRNIEHDFTSMQGNHAILHIPRQNNDEPIWLECTSQKAPFGFIGDFTDDRDVMVITPEGGVIKHTKKYNISENSQIIQGQVELSPEGHIAAKVTVSSRGIQYDNKYWLESEPIRELDAHYKKRWRYINNIVIDKMDLVNDKDSIQFNETLNFSAINYSKVIGDRMLVNINALNRINNIPDRYKDRKLPLKIYRGFIDTDELEIKLPQGYGVESLPKKESIENKFGSYQSEIVPKNESTLIYKRQFVINDGEFPKEDYEAYREFYKEVVKLDNSKMALIKIQP